MFWAQRKNRYESENIQFCENRGLGSCIGGLLAKRKPDKMKPNYKEPWDHPKPLDLHMSGDDVLKVSDRGEI